MLPSSTYPRRISPVQLEDSAGMPDVSQVTVCTEPTGQTSPASGDVIGGETTTVLARGTVTRAEAEATAASARMSLENMLMGFKVDVRKVGRKSKRMRKRNLQETSRV